MRNEVPIGSTSIKPARIIEIMNMTNLVDSGSGIDGYSQRNHLGDNNGLRLS